MLIPINDAIEKDIERASTMAWGKKFPTKDYPKYPCPECGEMTRPVEAWVNQKNR